MKNKNSEDFILIIDFGSQVTQLIARRLRELNVYCEIKPFQKININFFNSCSPSGIILSGGPSSVTSNIFPKLSFNIFRMKIPILAICYGQQLMSSMMGGKVVSAKNTSEFGKAFVTKKSFSPIIKGFFKNNREQVWMSHGDIVSKLPKGFKIVASSDGSPNAIISDDLKCFYGVQFHPEVYHTINGKKIFENFISISKAKKNWTMSSYAKDSIQHIKSIVKNEKVICALSGGVDSAVTAVLIHKAIGKNLTCIYVDHGMMRKNETTEIKRLFKENFEIKLNVVNASKLFFEKLKGIKNPEIKRKIIGKLFIKIFEKEAKKIGNVKFLGQGTLYPDIIESVSFSGGPSVTIKSHHNVGGLPKKMGLKLIEPLRQLFKDEVRILGNELGISKAFINRHPFPGPGLAIRCLGLVTKKKISALKEADEIFINQIKKYQLYDHIWQAFATILPVKTVGVMGDKRTYENVCCLRAVTSLDGMTAEAYKFDLEFLTETATKIVNEVERINRVTYDITSKPPGTIEWE